MPNWELVRQDFSELRQTMNGERLAYLDNAATSLKPKSVIERLFTNKRMLMSTGEHTSYHSRQLKSMRMLVKSFSISLMLRLPVKLFLLGEQQKVLI